MIKIDPSGDYVQLKYVDTLGEYVQEELKSDTDAIEYSSASNGKVFLRFGKMSFEDIEPTEFTINGSAVTSASDFVTKLTALFTGGGGGATIYTGDGSLNGTRMIDLNGHILNVNDGSNVQIAINPEAFTSVYTAFDGTADVGMIAQANIGTNNIHLVLFADDSGGGNTEIYCQINADHSSFVNHRAGKFRFWSDGDNETEPNYFFEIVDGEIVFSGIVVKDFANDGAAASGGVPVGGLYHTSGTLKIRIS